MVKEILVVDDEADTLESIKELMGRECFEVACVSSGEECIEKVKEKKYDLIMIDIYMPGMSGEELFKVLRGTINHLTPLMYITIKPRVEVDLTDVDGFIQKPFENRELVRQVKMAIKNFKVSKK